MTIRLPKKTVLDSVLHLIGKKRAIYIPKHAIEKFGVYSTLKAQKESFVKSLLSSKNRKLPDGWVYLEDVKEPMNE